MTIKRTLLLLFGLALLSGCASFDGIVRGKQVYDVAHQTSSVELDADDNGGIDTNRGGTNAITAAGARAVLAVPNISSGTDTPTVDWDVNSTPNYAVGDIYIETDTSPPSAWQCMSNADGAADWDNLNGDSATAVTSSSTITDNAIVRGDGGTRGAQSSGITVDDSNNMEGVASLTMDRSTTAGDQIDFREGSNNGDSYSSIKGKNSQSYDNIFELWDKDGFERLGPKFPRTLTADFTCNGDDCCHEVWFISGAGVDVNLDEVTNIEPGCSIEIHALDAEDHSINPNANDGIYYNNAGTYESMGDGDAARITDIGWFEIFRRTDGNGWNLVKPSVTIADAGAGCSGWNCGLTTDANCVAWYHLDNGTILTDEKGAWSFTTNSGTATNNTTDYIQGDASTDFEAGSNQYLSLSGTVDDYGWASSNALSITGWVKAESSAQDMTIFQKASANKKAIRIQYRGNNNFQLAVDGDDDDSYADDAELHGSLMTDSQWYFFAVTLNLTTAAYKMHIYDQTAGATLGTDATGTFAQGVANFNQDGTITLSDSFSTNDFDGLIDEITVWNKILTDSEISQIRQGTYGQ